MGQTEEAIERWKAAQNAALSGNSFPIMKNLGFLALELDQPVNALQALYTAFNAGIEFSQNQLGRLLQLTLENGSLNQTIKVAEALRDNYPEEPVHQNNLAYFRFLANISLEDSVETMRQLVEEYPDVNQYRLTLALGLLKLGRNNEAKRLLDSTSIDWNQAGTRGKMIYAAVLAANNQRVVAEGLIANIEFEDLIPEEQALLESN
jgi:tetratricopeptide (TPR) repeat protein